MDGSFQRRVIADYERTKQEYDDFLALKQSVAERIEQAKLNAIAPGLGSKPPLITARNNNNNKQNNSSSSAAIADGAKSGRVVDYLEFEHGLPPANPWDTPADDMEQLKSVFPTKEQQQQQNVPLQSKSSASSLNSNGEGSMTTKSKLLAKISSAGGNIADKLASPLSSLPASLSTPLSKISTTISSTRSSSSANSDSGRRFLSPPPPPPPSYSSSQTNKYARLNSSFNDVVSMGFESDILDAGIRLYPSDGGKTMNFCLAVLNYEKQGHDRLAVFDAIELYGKADPEDKKVASYLDAFSNIKELGFSSEQVREALVATEPKDAGGYRKWSEQAAAKLLN